MMTIIFNLLMMFQLPLVPENLTPITQGIFDAVVQATDAQDQSVSNLNEIAGNYRRISVNCSAGKPDVMP